MEAKISELVRFIAEGFWSVSNAMFIKRKLMKLVQIRTFVRTLSGVRFDFVLPVTELL